MTKSEVEGIMLIHYYEGNTWLGQALIDISCSSVDALEALLSLLASGERRLTRETPAIPEDSDEFYEINEILETVYSGISTQGDPYMARRIEDRTNNVRVIQLIPHETIFN